MNATGAAGATANGLVVSDGGAPAVVLVTAIVYPDAAVSSTSPENAACPPDVVKVWVPTVAFDAL